MSHDVYQPPEADLVAAPPDRGLDVPAHAGVGELLGIGLRWSLNGAGVLVPVALTVYALAFLTQTGMSLMISRLTVGAGQSAMGAFAMTGPIVVFGLLVQILFTAAGEQARLYALIEHQRGAPGGFGASLRFAISRLWPACWAELRRTLILIVGVVLCLIPGLMVWPRLAFIAQCVALDPEHGPLDRSFTLSADRAGRVFLFLVSVTAITVLLSLPFQLPTLIETAAPGLLPAELRTGSPAAMVIGVVSGIVMSIISIWGAAANLALYLSIRAEPSVVEEMGAVRVPWAEQAP